MNSALANAWLRPAPEAMPDRQMLVGDGFDVTETRDGWCFGRATKDGYEGWVRQAELGPAISASHFVARRTTWGYEAADLKSRPVVDFHMTSPMEVLGISGDWAEVRFDTGSLFLPAAHLRRLDGPFDDPVDVAREFLGTPYLWAGNSGFGIDCSGLVQAAFRATGRICAADSGDQEKMEGIAPESAAKGDLIFWKGHVALMSGPDAILHANAHHMAVVEEGMEAAIARISATDTGPVTSILRPNLPRG